MERERTGTPRGGPHSANSRRSVRILVAHADVLTFQADVLALKYAQDLYGADLSVTQRITVADTSLGSLPAPGETRLVDARGQLGVQQVLYVGVEPLRTITYASIREFAYRALTAVAERAPAARHVCATIHGPGFGLDEREAFRAEVAGFLDALAQDRAPAALDAITVVEFHAARSERLTTVLKTILPDGLATIGREPDRLAAHPRPGDAGRTERALTALGDVGSGSSAKPHAFVAMPFDPAFDDAFHYGINRPVGDVGLLCERADLGVFTGDVLSWVQSRIDSAHVVIADLSTANPNVYLELGYAWGRGVPAVLVVRDAAELKFDTRGQRCLVYKNIRDLEQRLRTELAALSTAARLR